MSRFRSTRIFLLFAVTIALLLPVLPAGAGGNDRIAQGDVTGHFQAGYVSGAPILFRGGPAADNASPAGWFRGGIRPFIGTPWADSFHCEDDWHVLLVGISDGPPFAFTRQEATPFLDTIDVRLFLDEVQLETERTAIKPLLGELGWVHQTGTFFAPGELAPGEYSFRAEYRSPFFEPEGVVFTDGPITFTVDASGTGACL